MLIIRYSEDFKMSWDEFVSKSKNFHFIFFRDFMEYHKDRFNDFSLMVFNKKDKLIAVLPANIENDILYSHQGLTFGGFIVDNSMKTELMLEIFQNLKEYLKKSNIRSIVYKCIPYIYHTTPAEEDRYALFFNNALLIRRDVSAAINLNTDFFYKQQRKGSIKKAKKYGLKAEQSNDFAAFWKILEDILTSYHRARPTHSYQEIQYLADKFPDNIKLFVSKLNGAILAGAVVFELNRIVHTQYLANSIDGRNSGALDLVLDYLISDFYKDKDFFDFGSSCEENGKILNKGLMAQKEAFGARAVSHDFYELEIL